MINTCSSNESSDTPLLELPGGGQDAGPGVREGPRQPAGDQAPQRPPHDQVHALEGMSVRTPAVIAHFSVANHGRGGRDGGGGGGISVKC